MGSLEGVVSTSTPWNGLITCPTDHGASGNAEIEFTRACNLPGPFPAVAQVLTALEQFWSGLLRETRWKPFPTHQPERPSRGSSASATSPLAAAASSAPAASAACLCVGVRVGCRSYCIEGGDESCKSLIGLIPIYHVLRCCRDILVANFCCLERPQFLVWGLQGELEVKPSLQLMHGAIQGGWCGVGECKGCLLIMQSLNEHFYHCFLDVFLVIGRHEGSSGLLYFKISSAWVAFPRVTGAAIERWDFHLLLYKADMGPFVSLRRKVFPVPGHLIAGTPLKFRSVHHQRTVHRVRGDVQSHYVAAVSLTIPGRGLGHGLDGLLDVTGDGRARGR
ncbi:Xylose isomerase, partial [Frankliniella fusca]